MTASGDVALDIRNLRPMLRRLAWLSPLACMLAACGTTAPMPRPQPPPDTTVSSDRGDPPLRAAPPQAPAIASPIVVPLDDAILARLPREPVDAVAHGKPLHCDGIALVEVLRAGGAMPAEPLRGAQLARYVQVDARDGYRVVYALAELDPTLGARKVFLTDRCDGRALPPEDGPWRLVAPGDARPARWVRQVKAVTVIVAP